MTEEQNFNNAETQQLNIADVSGCSLLEIIEKYDKDYRLSKELKNYVNEHIYKWDLTHHNYKGSYRDWLSENNR
jgi:hypothetical protein